MTASNFVVNGNVVTFTITVDTKKNNAPSFTATWTRNDPNDITVDEGEVDGSYSQKGISITHALLAERLSGARNLTIVS